MNLEAKVLSAVLNDKQIHVLMQANVSELLYTHKDVWDFIRDYYEKNQAVPAPSVVNEKFSDWGYLDSTGHTKYHLDELRDAFVNDSVRAMLRNAANDVQDG